MTSSRRSRGLAFSVVALIAAGCSGGDALPPAVLVATTAPITTATSAPATADVTSTTIPADAASPGDTDTLADGAILLGLDASSVFNDNASELAPETVFLVLDPSDLAALDARFRADPRIEPFLDGVDARAVRNSEALAAVVLSVSVALEALATPGFTDSFVEGATAGGTVKPLPDQLGPAELTTWITDDAGHMLWQHENLFVVFSGRDLLEVREVAGIVIASTLGLTLDSVLGDTTSPEGADADG